MYPDLLPVPFNLLCVTAWLMWSLSLCLCQEEDALGAMEKVCRQLTYHLSPHSQWRRQGLLKRKPQAWWESREGVSDLGSEGICYLTFLSITIRLFFCLHLSLQHFSFSFVSLLRVPTVMKINIRHFVELLKVQSVYIFLVITYTKSLGSVSFMISYTYKGCLYLIKKWINELMNE